MKPNVYVSQGVADTYPLEYRVYTYVRSMDLTGSGRYRGPLSALAASLGLDTDTLRHTLSSAYQIGLFHTLQIGDDGAVLIRYASTKHICRSFDKPRSLVPSAPFLFDIML